MNRDQKAAAIAEIATHIDESEAIFAVDYRGITVAQLAELRTKLREIAERKLDDLNAHDVEQAAKIIAGTARSMGVEVEA